MKTHPCPPDLGVLGDGMIMQTSRLPGFGLCCHCGRNPWIGLFVPPSPLLPRVILPLLCGQCIPNKYTVLLQEENMFLILILICPKHFCSFATSQVEKGFNI